MAELTTPEGDAQYPALALLVDLDAYLSIRPTAAKGSQARGNTLYKLRSAALSDLSRAYRELRPTDPSLAACALYLIAVLLDSSLLRVASAYGSEGIMESLERRARTNNALAAGVLSRAKDRFREEMIQQESEIAFSLYEPTTIQAGDPFSLQDLELAMQMLSPLYREVILWFLKNSSDGRIEDGAPEVEARRRGIQVNSMWHLVLKAKTRLRKNLQIVFERAE